MPALPELDRTLVMGVLNVTPDSFSDGGQFSDAGGAIAYGRTLAAAGADIIDVGGESTRPGAEPISIEEEHRRVLPVVEALAAGGLVVSIDTMHAQTAVAAVKAGAVLVNDVSGGLADPDMGAVVARLDVDYVAMHWRADSKKMDAEDQYANVVGDVRDELGARIGALTRAGIAPERIILDPGLGFSKVTDSNWPLLARMREWAGDSRVLVGASRKRFLGAAIARDGIAADDPSLREHATTAVTALASAAGAWGVRVHDPAAARDAIAVANAWQNAQNGTR
jgi:dihydropteroate synthase